MSIISQVEALALRQENIDISSDTRGYILQLDHSIPLEKRHDAIGQVQRVFEVIISTNPDSTFLRTALEQYLSLCLNPPNEQFHDFLDKPTDTRVEDFERLLRNVDIEVASVVKASLAELDDSPDSSDLAITQIIVRLLVEKVEPRVIADLLLSELQAA